MELGLKRKLIEDYLQIYKLKVLNIKIKFYLINLWINIKIEKDPISKVGISKKILLIHFQSFMTRKSQIKILINIVT